MRCIHEVLRKSLSQKFLGKQAIGAIAQYVIRKLFPEYGAGITVYVRANVVFIKTTNHWYKVVLYKDTKKILDIVNSALNKIGYRYTVDRVVFK